MAAVKKFFAGRGLGYWLSLAALVLGFVALGLYYNNGLGITRNDAAAVEWYKKSAVQGNSQAQLHLGNCYYNGQGVAQDCAQAVKWYQKAAERGYVYAQNNLGYCYYNGYGVAQDYTQAVE